MDLVVVNVVSCCSLSVVCCLLCGVWRLLLTVASVACCYVVRCCVSLFVVDCCVFVA